MSENESIDLNAMRDQLETERRSLVAMNEASADDSRPVPLDQQSVGRLSRMDAMRVQAMAKAVEGRRCARIHMIEAALARMEGSEYGACHSCGEDIAPKRLELDPAASQCIDCKN